MGSGPADRKQSIGRDGTTPQVRKKGKKKDRCALITPGVRQGDVRVASRKGRLPGPKGIHKKEKKVLRAKTVLGRGGCLL